MILLLAKDSPFTRLIHSFCDSPSGEGLTSHLIASHLRLFILLIVSFLLEKDSLFTFSLFAFNRLLQEGSLLD